MNVNVIWTNFLNSIKEQITSLAFDTWFKDTKLVELTNGKAIILVPMHIHKKHLIENYSEMIENTLNLVTGTNFEIDFILEEELNDNNDIDIDVDMIGVPTEKVKLETNLNPKYLFDNFIVGESNRFAHAAALSVAENPGRMYNPLFIYGKSGLGKTHLMHAIGNYISNNTSKNVLYVTSEQFITDFLGINKKDKKGTNFDYVDYFKNKYRNIDVLIIDDIQFLGSAQQTQQEFFHTFNKLYDDNKQIIISSDRSPDDLKILEDRLRTRFSWGLSVNIFPPDFELRKQILLKKISGQGMSSNVPNDVIEYIANNCQSDVRQLEGAVTRLFAYATMMSGSDITLDLAIDALKDYLNKSIGTKNSVQRIQRVVADYYQISVEDIKSKKRHASIAYPRQIAMYLTRKLTDESFPKIGIEFGGRDHSTVIHSVDKIAEEINQNKQLKNLVETLEEQIK